MILESTALTLALLFTFSCSTPPDRTVLAQVDGEKIRAADLRNAFREERDQFGEDLLLDPEGLLTVKKMLLKGLIEETLLLQTAREKKISLTPEEEKALETQLRSGYAGGEFEKILEKKQISLEDWMIQQKKKRMIEKLLQEEIYSRHKPSPREVEAFFEKHRSRFVEPDRVRCRHIVANKEDKADTILSLLQKGEPFAAVAQKYSESPDREQGGDLGYMTQGEEYPDIFVQACFSLATGQTSAVIPSPYGFHIFRVVDKKPQRPLSLKEASPAIEALLREEKGRVMFRPWVDEIQRNKKIILDEKALQEVSIQP